jgi:protein TonB
MRLRYQSLVAILAGLTCIGGTSASAQTPTNADQAAASRPPIVTNPGWARRPSVEYPERALGQNVGSGLVRLDCGFAADGSLTSCEVTEETPAGMGFGAAALRGVRSAQLSPTTIDGVPENARVRFSIPFSLGR